MLITALVLLSLGRSGPEPGLHCPTSLEAITGAPAVLMEFGGATFGTCCGSCDGPFSKDPAGSIAKAIKANMTVGVFGYDPVSGKKIDVKGAVAFSDYKAIRYRFASAAEKKTFDLTPAKFLPAVKSEAYECPVTGDKMTSDTSQGYADFNGVRYYLCCPQCTTAFRKNPAKYAASVASAVKPFSVHVLK